MKWKYTHEGCQILIINTIIESTKNGNVFIGYKNEVIFYVFYDKEVARRVKEDIK